MKICSLLPSSTEIVFALGLGDSLVGVTHECDYPAETAGIPSVTSSVVNGESMSGKDIHDAITGLVHGGSSIYNLDQKLLDEAGPDLILTQELCDVCAVSYHQVEAAAAMLQCDSRVVSLEPSSVGEILDTIRIVGEMAGVEGRAEEVIRWAEVPGGEGGEDCFTSAKQASGAVHGVARPGVRRAATGCRRWWLWRAGRMGWALRASRRSRSTGTRICGIQPRPDSGDALRVQCGPDDDGVGEDDVFPDEWHELDAVKRGEVYVVDGSSYFNRPGPRVVDGLEILAQILHPELFSAEGAKFGGMVKTPYPVRATS